MKRLNGSEYEIIENEYGKFAIVRVGSRFGICKWNSHHNNWVRTNRNNGGGIHRNPVSLMTDNLGGGPVLMTLTHARELVGDGEIS